MGTLGYVKKTQRKSINFAQLRHQEITDLYMYSPDDALIVQSINIDFLCDFFKNVT